MPRSRRERPAKPALSAQAIVDAAAEIMRTDGLERVTVRRLAEELDTGPASLYVYFRNTAELHAAVLDELLGQVDLSPAAADGSWRTRLVAILTSYIDVLYAHPGLARAALVARPRGANYLDLVETLLGVLEEGGLEVGRAAWALDLLLQFATTSAAEHGSRREDPDSSEDWAALTNTMRSVDAAAHPRILAARDALFSGTPTARMQWSFLVLINGILTAPDPGTADVSGATFS